MNQLYFIFYLNLVAALFASFQVITQASELLSKQRFRLWLIFDVFLAIFVELSFLYWMLPCQFDTVLPITSRCCIAATKRTAGDYVNCNIGASSLFTALFVHETSKNEKKKAKQKHEGNSEMLNAKTDCPEQHCNISGEYLKTTQQENFELGDKPTSHYELKERDLEYIMYLEEENHILKEDYKKLQQKASTLRGNLARMQLENSNLVDVLASQNELKQRSYSYMSQLREENQTLREDNRKLRRERCAISEKARLAQQENSELKEKLARTVEKESTFCVEV